MDAAPYFLAEKHSSSNLWYLGQNPIICCLETAWCDSGHGGGAFAMSELFLLTERQMGLLWPFFSGEPRVDDRRVASGIIM